MKWLFLPLLFSVSVLAQDWTSVLGPAQDNSSKEKITNLDWKEKPPEILWSRELGLGYSAFSVKDKHAYCMGHVAGKEFVYKLDADTGKPAWMIQYAGGKVDRLHIGGPAATPVLDGDRVFILGREGQLKSLDAADGSVTWEKDLREVFGVKVPEWGFSGSPVIHGKLLLVQGGPLAAFDKTTGELKWKTETYKHGYGTIHLFEHDGQTLAAALTNDGVLITDLKGKERAKHLWKTSYRTNGTTPIHRGGQIFISTGYRRGCTLLDFKGDALAEVYENKGISCHMANPVPSQDGKQLYGIDGNSHYSQACTLRCVDWKTGEVRWKQKNVGCGTVLRAGKHLLVLEEDGELVLADASPAGYTERGRIRLFERGKCWTSPTFINGRVYARNDFGAAVCVDLDPAE